MSTNFGRNPLEAGQKFNNIMKFINLTPHAVSQSP